MAIESSDLKGWAPNVSLNRLRLVAVTSSIAVIFAIACGRPDSSRRSTSQPATSAPKPTTGCTRGKRDGHDYLFCSDRLSFEAARALCQKSGLDLVSVDSQEEDDYVRTNIQADAYIGITDQKQEGVWKWVADERLTTCGQTSGERYDSSLYANWAPQQPPEVHCTDETQNGRAYWLCRDAANWGSASAACRSVGMQLARINDSAENDFISRRLTLDAWLGATDRDAQGEWRWLDADTLFWTGGLGGSAVNSAYTNWKKGSPSNLADVDCLVMDQRNHGAWRSDSCGTTSNGWVCEGAVATTPQIPDVRDCTLLRTHDGRWVAGDCTAAEAFVCETKPKNAGKTLNEIAEWISDDYRSGQPNVGNVRYKSDSGVLDPFSGYGDRFGLRACVDTLRPSDAGPGYDEYAKLETVSYGQYYRGVQVHGGAYLAFRDPTTKVVQRIVGTFWPNINVDVQPVISEQSAFQSALVASKTSTSDYGTNRPHGNLVVYPLGYASSKWELAWEFRLPEPENTEIPKWWVAVSAKDGHVLHAKPGTPHQRATAIIPSSSTP